MTHLSPLQLGLLALASLCAGTIDAIAGGGGLVTVPALLAVGLPPQLALGTNKGQSVFGSFAALLRYLRAKLVDRRRALILFPLGALGSLGGALLMLRLRPEVLRPLVLVLLVGVAVFLAFRRGPRTDRPVPPPRRAALLGGAVALVVGAYDGFFGPGTGTFLIAAFVGLLGLTLPQATAEAKVVNFASNLAALSIFASRGVVLWYVALPMAAAQFAGGWLGAHLAVKGGARLIRVVVLAVVAALCVKIVFDLRG